jgi:hypothetical protein
MRVDCCIDIFDATNPRNFMSNEYTIGTVVLGFGPQTMDWLGKASKACGGKDAVMDPNVARMAGANMAVGSPAALDLMREHLKPSAKAKFMADWSKDVGFNGRTLDERALEWLAWGDRGASSNAMAAHLFGERFFLNGGNPKAHPYDADDFSRCIGLIEAVPFLEPLVPRMAAVSPTWALIAEQWTRLTGLWVLGTKESRSEISKVLRGITRPGS